MFSFRTLLQKFRGINILYSILQNTSVDFAYGIRKIKNFVEYLSNDLRNEAAFNDCYSAAETKAGASTRRSERRTNYKQLYYEVIDSIVAMCNERFSDAESFSFLDLVNPKFFNQWENAVLQEKILQLREKYGPLFDIPKLQSQLQFVYQDKDFQKETPAELLRYIFSINMQDCVPEFVKLLKLNEVMAVSRASAERSFSCLGRVKSYLRNSTGDQRLSSLCRISIHKNILKEKEDKKELHHCILEKFIHKPRRLNFLYK